MDSSYKYKDWLGMGIADASVEEEQYIKGINKQPDRF
jgi:hypothetical protein